MQAKGWIMLRVLMNRFHHPAKDTMLLPLAQEVMQAVQAQEVDSSDPSAALGITSDWILNIHYSWWIPVIQKIPTFLRPSVLSLLPEQQRSKVIELMGLSKGSQPLPPLAPPVRAFLTNKMYHLLGQAEVLPIAFLPHSSMMFLSEMDKGQLVELIDYLGLYDLAAEFRHIIDKTRWKTLYACLDVPERQFLRICLHRAEKIEASRLGLEKWSGTVEDLHRLLHRRGLIRFGKALCGQHPDLIWHLSHVLDTGRGLILLKNFSTQATPGVTLALAQQLFSVRNFLKTKSNE